MTQKSKGIHHITAIVGHPQENVDFYAGVLGLRLVKQTVNFDDPKTYHFYFGDEGGKPGTIITFFPWVNSPQGIIGDGQVGVTSYAIPTGAIGYWEERLNRFNIQFHKENRFGNLYLQFDDPHGLHLELVETSTGDLNNWRFDDIHPQVAIKGFAGAILYSLDYKQTANLIEKTFGFEYVGEDDTYLRFKSEAEIGNIIDIKKERSGLGQYGVGTVHHIALRAADLNDQIEWQNRLKEHGYGVTEVKDRNYFTSVYFRDRGIILFEIATDVPGFAVDEAFEELGKALKLPKQYEPYRQKIEKGLLPFEVRVLNKE
jgi:glyoxalase family protein